MTDSTTTTAPVAPDQTGVREIIEAEILDDFIGLFPEDELSVRAAASRTAYRSMRRISTLTPAPAAGDDRVTISRLAARCGMSALAYLHVAKDEMASDTERAACIEIAAALGGSNGDE